jgi:hypothetical protein
MRPTAAVPGLFHGPKYLPIIHVARNGAITLGITKRAGAFSPFLSAMRNGRSSGADVLHLLGRLSDGDRT